MFCECAVCERARRSGGRNIRTRSQAIVDEDLLIDFPADAYLHVLYGGLRLEKVPLPMRIPTICIRRILKCARKALCTGCPAA